MHTPEVAQDMFNRAGQEAETGFDEFAGAVGALVGGALGVLGGLGIGVAVGTVIPPIGHVAASHSGIPLAMTGAAGGALAGARMGKAIRKFFTS
jgi:hypothetical protein